MNKQIQNSLEKTFPSCSLEIQINSKKTKLFGILGELCSFNILDEDIGFYSNPIFTFSISKTELTFITKYMSPCMFIIDKLHKGYDKINEHYQIQINYSENLSSSDMIFFDLNNSFIPVEYVNMLVDFFDYENNNSINQIIIKKSKLDYNLFVQDILDEEFDPKQIYMDFKKQSTLKILDTSWLVCDLGVTILKLDSTYNYTLIVKKFFDYVKEKQFKTLSDFSSDLNTFFANRPHELRTVAKAEGGIELSAIFYSFGYSYLVNHLNNDIYASFIRDCTNHNDSKGRIYSGYYSDLLCVIVLNEMLKKFGLVTELSINQVVYSNKSNALGCIIY